MICIYKLLVQIQLSPSKLTILIVNIYSFSYFFKKYIMCADYVYKQSQNYKYIQCTLANVAVNIWIRWLIINFLFNSKFNSKCIILKLNNKFYFIDNLYINYFNFKLVNNKFYFFCKELDLQFFLKETYILNFRVFSLPSLPFYLQIKGE